MSACIAMLVSVRRARGNISDEADTPHNARKYQGATRYPRFFHVGIYTVLNQRTIRMKYNKREVLHREVHQGLVMSVQQATGKGASPIREGVSHTISCATKNSHSIISFDSNCRGQIGALYAGSLATAKSKFVKNESSNDTRQFRVA